MFEQYVARPYCLFCLSVVHNDYIPHWVGSEKSEGIIPQRLDPLLKLQEWILSSISFSIIAKNRTRFPSPLIPHSFLLSSAFRNLYGVSISVQWLSGSGKSRHEEHDEESPLAPPGLKSMGVKSLTSPRFQLCRDPKRPPPLPTPPSPLQPQVFPREVGGPTLQVTNVMLPLKSSSVEEPLHDSVHELHWLCELHGLGEPLYNMRYDHTGPDGFLYFAYRVMVPGLDMPFCGVVHVLPSTCANNMKAEVQRAAAKQLLEAIWQARNH